MLRLIWLGVAVSFGLWVTTSVMLWMWRRSETRQATERDERIKRMVRAIDPEAVMWKSHMRRTEQRHDDEDA